MEYFDDRTVASCISVTLHKTTQHLVPIVQIFPGKEPSSLWSSQSLVQASGQSDLYVLLKYSHTLGLSPLTLRHLW